jgi:hypothetical protein
MFIVFPPEGSLSPVSAPTPPSNFTLSPAPPTFTGGFPGPPSMAVGTAPVQPNQWVFGAFQPQSMESVLFTPAGPYPLPPVPIIPIPPPPVTADDLGVTMGNALGLANNVDNLGVLT